MFCEKCGAKISENAKFCSSCGEKVQSKGSSGKRELITNKCGTCGAMIKMLTPNRYLCEYCGSEYYTTNDGEITDSKLTEKEVLDIFYQAAKYENAGKFWEELQCLLGSIDKLSDNVTYYIKLGRAYRRNDMHAKALECYEKAKELNSNDATIYTNIGAVYIFANRFKEAEENCKKATEMMQKDRVKYTQNDYAVAFSNLAIAVGKRGRKDEAKRYLKFAEDNSYKNGDTVRKMIGIKKGLFF